MAGLQLFCDVIEPLLQNSFLRLSLSLLGILLVSGFHTFLFFGPQFIFDFLQGFLGGVDLLFCEDVLISSRLPLNKEEIFGQGEYLLQQLV